MTGMRGVLLALASLLLVGCGGGDGEGRPHAFAWPPRLACEVGLRMYGHTKRGRPRGAFVPAAAARSDRVQPASEDI